MTRLPTPQPGIMDIALYQGGQSHLAGVSDVLKLSSNENPFGCAPSAREAFVAAGAKLHLYPPTDHAALRTAIGKVHGLDPDRILCAVGSDEIITFLCQAYAGPGDEVIYPQHGFLMYPISAMGAGATPVVAPERDRCVDVDALLAAVTPATRLIFLAEPANPTSTAIGQAELDRLARGLPDGVLLVLDGAYAEFAEGYDGGAGLVDRCGNVFMMRTFSKAYGLGGMRVGWGYGPRAVIDVLNRLRGPFNLSTPALAAAEAAMKDRAFVEGCIAENARLRTILTEGLRALGLGVDTSAANFVLARFADPQTAEACDMHLRDAGIIVRRVSSYGLPHALRITVGTEAGCARVLAAITTFTKSRE